MKKTKIVATIGLVSDKKEIIAKMIEAGMNVARLNFSHGDHAWHGKVIASIREASKAVESPIGILADLQGPRIRTVVKEDITLKPGDEVEISDVADTKSACDILLDVPKIIEDISVGNDILIEDGLIKLVVLEKKNGSIKARVIDGGVVKNHKGVNIPDAPLRISAITKKDERDLEFALQQGVDFVALSFVSSGSDIETLRDKIKHILKREDHLPQVVAKIERKEAIKNLDDIINHTDAVMVARGDLGIEMEESKVVILQKEIIKKCLLNVKPVIVATQMLDSMIEKPRPTRAEVSDVTNAVVDHADALMLSGETASGKYPLESISTMAKIITETEESPFDDASVALDIAEKSVRIDLIRSAFKLSSSSGAKAIVMGSARGFTARLMSHFRPKQTIFVVTDNETTYRQLSIAWGVRVWLYTRGGVFREDIDWMIQQLKEKSFISANDLVVVIMGQMKGDEKMKLIGVKEIE